MGKLLEPFTGEGGRSFREGRKNNHAVSLVTAVLLFLNTLIMRLKSATAITQIGDTTKAPLKRHDSTTATPLLSHYKARFNAKNQYLYFLLKVLITLKQDLSGKK